MSADSKRHIDRLTAMKDGHYKEQYLYLLQGYSLADINHKEYQRKMEEWLNNIYEDYLRDK